MDRPPLVFCECCGRGLPMHSAIAEEQPHRCPRCGRNVCRACLHSGFHICIICLRQASEELEGKNHAEVNPMLPSSGSQICPTCHRLICEHCWSKQGFPRCGDCPKTVKEPPAALPLSPSINMPRKKRQESNGLLFLAQIFFWSLFWFNEILNPVAIQGRIIIGALLSMVSLGGVFLAFWGKQPPAVRP